MAVARIRVKHGIKSRLLKGHLTSTDPEFGTKAANVIGLYLKPPHYAVVLSVDEKAAIQGLDRLDPMLPLSSGRDERHGFEYFRCGPLSPCAAFNTKTGDVVGRTVDRGTPRPSSWRYSPTSLPTSPGVKRSTSSQITSRSTRPSTSKRILPITATYICISLPRTHPGSTRWSCRSPRSSAISSLQVYLRPCLT
jgi:hypothetical protein